MPSLTHLRLNHPSSSFYGTFLKIVCSLVFACSASHRNNSSSGFSVFFFRLIIAERVGQINLRITLSYF
ncbi:hypothetical protein V6Z11_D04G160900 [Gossypium hirsutum]